jgi:myosin heavy subunit
VSCRWTFTYWTDALVLHAIATRYALHLPYTYSGIVLVISVVYFPSV